MITTSHALVENLPSDLRRKRTLNQRRAIAERAELLDPRERRLMRDVFRDDRTCVKLARELGEDVRTLRRRVRSITRRLLDPRFDFVATNLALPAAKRPRGWRPTRCKFAEAHYIRGMSLREITREFGMSIYAVRQHRDAIEAMFEAAGDLADYLRG